MSYFVSEEKLLYDIKDYYDTKFLVRFGMNLSIQGGGIKCPLSKFDLTP